ncbi:plasmid mobilization relaxosome protein MobC [Campylobacter upsaliensis]|uniref:Plasmid mobilization relaxosome protein MobC n=1 Tax=Campylobacter upsaliensis TaxID=28080 RepID=A0A5L4SS44_CAMUP|nr:plasmid mobilization relaxosome protein MobC [Campylobacter upsaliensis]EAI8054135.1 plasmid mobilization relaxosome protein MobC [Campylobacter upsaliensis]EAJ4502942.1 plasmid mobilization relaxosome protein MobC [Campylobacter upsaliensis]EAJ5080110.1 plasmid mobilization relaxosome protein MobC [Campylobacter upsaliensis]EAK0955161.1 plasmid mobilization relaxosome protein MobC [Campylobacter upsaliensis]EAK2502807.1 plasmid mobilization relaxosome protein MobC [Campylobacter upsaliensi
MKNGLNLYLNPKEKVLLKTRAKQAGITQSAYLRALLLNEKYLKQKDTLELLAYINKELLNHLEKIGHNINQIAYALNSGVSKSSQSTLNEIQTLKKLLKEHKIFINNQVKIKIFKSKEF